VAGVDSIGPDILMGFSPHWANGTVAGSKFFLLASGAVANLALRKIRGPAAGCRRRLQSSPRSIRQFDAFPISRQQ